MIGVWAPELTVDDERAGARRAKKRPEKEREEPERRAEDYNGSGNLFAALNVRGGIRRELEPGKWAIDCLRASDHSKDGETSTILFAPGEGEVIGWIHCSHSGCGHDRFTLQDWLGCFSKEELAAARVAAGVPDRTADGEDQRPVIRCSNELHLDADAAVLALGGDPELYQKDAKLVHVLRAAESNEDAAAGTPQVRTMAAATLRERLTRVAQWEKFDARSQSWRPSVPTEHLVQAVLARGEWSGIRPIVAVAEAPFLRPDGSIFQVAGYDPKTCFVLAPSAQFPRVSEEPTQNDARAALAALVDVFADFPYAAEAQRMVPIAALLTLLARPAIHGACPAFLFDANVRGCGKTLQLDAVMILVTCRPAPRLSFPKDDEPELEKVLGACALYGAAYLTFDNVSGQFGGGPLDRVLTARETVQLRVLGKSEAPALRWHAVVLATGNNIELVGDTSRRVVRARLESALENPETRPRADYRHPKLLDYVTIARTKLVAAGLAVLRSFIVAGSPGAQRHTWGSFDEWAALVPPAIVYAGGANVLDARPIITGEEEPEKQVLEAILAHWPKLGPEGITAKGALDRLYSPWRIAGLPGPSGSDHEFDDLREAIEAIVPTPQGRAPSAARLGSQLRRFCGRVVGQRKLVSRSGHAGVARWIVVATTDAPRGSGGDGGHGGDVSHPKGQDCQNSSCGNSGERGPRHPHHSHHTHPYEDDAEERAAIQGESTE